MSKEVYNALQKQLEKHDVASKIVKEPGKPQVLKYETKHAVLTAATIHKIVEDVVLNYVGKTQNIRIRRNPDTKEVLVVPPEPTAKPVSWVSKR